MREKLVDEEVEQDKGETRASLVGHPPCEQCARPHAKGQKRVSFAGEPTLHLPTYLTIRLPFVASWNRINTAAGSPLSLRSLRIHGVIFKSKLESFFALFFPPFSLFHIFSDCLFQFRCDNCLTGSGGRTSA